MAPPIDAFDDLGTAKKPYKVVACLPVHGRLPLLRHTIERLYKKNGVYKVICSGDGVAERELCEELGAVWVAHQNKPLGAKWNAAFRGAIQFNPDAVLYVGSSDFLSDNWLPVMQPYVEQHGFAGVPGCHFLDIGGEACDELRCCYWPGYRFTKYHRDRFDETIGIGCMISGALMDKVGWEPFDSKYDNSLDRSMKERIFKYGQAHDFMVELPQVLRAVSLSTDRWPNKHNFLQHYNNFLPSVFVPDAEEFAAAYFPEIVGMFK